MSNLLTFLGAVFGSGAIAALISFLLGAKKDHAHFMRSKAEELYLKMDRLDKNISTYYMGGYQLIRGEISWNDFNDLHIKNSKDDQGDHFTQACMLVDIYFPKIAPHFQSYQSQRDDLAKIFFHHKRLAKEGKDGSHLFVSFDQRMKAFVAEGAELKRAIVDEARYHASTDRIWFWRRA